MRPQVDKQLTVQLTLAVWTQRGTTQSPATLQQRRSERTYYFMAPDSANVKCVVCAAGWVAFHWFPIA